MNVIPHIIIDFGNGTGILGKNKKDIIYFQI